MQTSIRSHVGLGRKNALPRTQGRPRVKRPTALALLCAITLALLVLNIVGPTLVVALASFTRVDLGARTMAWVGASNYLSLAADPAFRAALVNTAVYASIVTITTAALGTAIALALVGQRRLRRPLQTAFFLPVVSTMAAMALVWDTVLHPTAGPLADSFRALGFAPPNLLGSPKTALATLIVIGIWQNLGYAVLFALAALRSIPDEIMEAAALDRVTLPIERATLFFLPLLRPALLMIGLIVLQRSVSLFTAVRVLTNGGPDNATEVLLHYFFNEAFAYLNTGRAAAVAVVYLLLCVALASVQLLARARAR